MSVVIENISKSFAKRKVLQNLNLIANDGEILGLIGASGAGKTTLIKIMISALQQDSGVVRFDNVKLLNKKQFLQIGFMPQSDALYLDLSAIDNIKFFAKLYGIKNSKELEEKCTSVLEFMDLLADKNKLVMDFSGGMRKRLSLAISLIHNPKFLILDEPTVGIDPALRIKIWNYFQDLKSQGKTLIISTHIMDEAQSCDKVALMADGKIIACDSVSNLKSKTNSGKLEDLFLMHDQLN